MPSNVLRSVAVVASFCAISRGRAASAAPSAADLRAARELFAHAEADEDAGRWEEAIDKLRRVLDVKDTAGVRYHVALCEEHLGKLATARADYAAADQKARSEQARDVLRLVGKKIAELDPRVPRLTVRVVPSTEDATLLIDGRPAPLGAATAVDPGAHEIEILPAAHGATSTVAVSVQEGDSRALDVEVGPAASPAHSELSDRAPATRPATGDTPEPPPSRSHTTALVAAAGAVILAAGGAAAYAAAGAAQEQAYRSCAQTSAGAASGCDGYRLPVRAWDWVALGAWTGAGVMATLAVISWARAPAASGRVVVGPGSLRLEGAF